MNGFGIWNLGFGIACVVAGGALVLLGVWVGAKCVLAGGGRRWPKAEDAAAIEQELTE
jgi:hypothetical protein